MRGRTSRPAASATPAAAITGTPAGATGISRKATSPPPRATTLPERAFSWGQSRARNTAGAAASSPNRAGSMDVPTRAPIRLPVCQSVNRIRPVDQNAYRFARGSAWATAIAVVSSMTKCAVTSRRQPRGERISEIGTP